MRSVHEQSDRTLVGKGNEREREREKEEEEDEEESHVARRPRAH